MGVNGRNSRDNLVQVEIKGRNQPTNKNKKSNTVYRIKKSEPIRYTLEELRQIKRKVESNDKYKILGAEVCYMIRKLRLNRLCGKRRTKQAGGERRKEDPIMTQGLFSLRTEPNIDLSHKLLPRSPTMAFSSVRENVTPTLS